MSKWKFTGVLFRKEPDKNSATYSYQSRQTKLVSSSNISAVFWIGLVWYTSTQSLTNAFVLAFAILYIIIHYVAAVSSDSIFDSLWERINLQSKWLDFRMTYLEQQLRGAKKEMSAQPLWEANEAFEGQLSAAWEIYPEKEPNYKRFDYHAND